MQVRLLVLLGALMLAGILSGCAPTKGYEGPERPDTELSLVDIDYNSAEIDITERILNGISFNSSGIKALPNTQIYDIDVKLKDAPHYCSPYPEMDSYGYNECLRKNSYCDCYSYLTVKQDCTRRIHLSNCKGEFRSRAGQRYAIRVRRAGNGATAIVSEEPRQSALTRGKCTTYDDGEESYTETLGSGRSEAYRYGITWCG